MNITYNDLQDLRRAPVHLAMYSIPAPGPTDLPSTWNQFDRAGIDCDVSKSMVRREHEKNMQYNDIQ